MNSQSPSSHGKRKSGNPARQADINQNAKQQHAAERQRQAAEADRRVARRKRSKLVWWVVGATAAVCVVAVVAASIIFAPEAPNSYEAGSEGVEIEGVEEFSHVTTHVEGTVEYEQSPPAGGEHNAIWLNCGIYTEEVPNENAVHSLEHGAVWVTYDADALSETELESLKEILPTSYVVLSPYNDLDSPIVMSSWNHQLKVDSVDDERIGAFFEEYWRSQDVPEPTAVCTGALDAPGKES